MDLSNYEERMQKSLTNLEGSTQRFGQDVRIQES